jgi:hypothetical protein
MDIIDMARASGLTVILDGRIGRQEYQSVCGSLSALQRFAASLRLCAAHQQTCENNRRHGDVLPRHVAPRSSETEVRGFGGTSAPPAT